MRNIRCVVAAEANGSGSPELFDVIVRATEAQISDGIHYVAAKEAAQNQGFSGRMVAFDETEERERLFDSVPWDRVSIYDHNGNLIEDRSEI